VAIEITVAGGVVATGLFVLWLVLVAREARGPLALFAVAIGLTSLLQPLSVVATPLAMLCLGAAGPPALGVAIERWERLVVAGTALVGLSVGVTYVASDVVLAQAVEELSAPRFEMVTRLRSETSTTAIVRTAVLTRRAELTNDLNDIGAAILSARRGVQVDPDTARTWLQLANVEARFGSVSAAQSAIERALSLYPWSQSALVGYYLNAQELRDQAAASAAIEALCETQSPYCTNPPLPSATALMAPAAALGGHGAA
jgi:tetratricopeptide (TPR) repeat protein